MAVTRYVVTRLPGAALRRAGRAWDLGETPAQDLTQAQVAALEGDPGYRIAADLPPPSPLGGRGRGEGVTSQPAAAARPTRATRPRTKG